MCDSMCTLTFSPLCQFVRHPPLLSKMRISVPIILFVAVAGFHTETVTYTCHYMTDRLERFDLKTSKLDLLKKKRHLHLGCPWVISASLQCEERTKLPEERAFEENSTTPQTDELEYEAAHVKDGETKAVTDTTEEDDDEDSEEQKLLEKEDSDDGEREALTDATVYGFDVGANTGSDAPIDSDSEDDTSQQNTEHSEQVEEDVKSAEDFSDEEYGVYYNS